MIQALKGIELIDSKTLFIKLPAQVSKVFLFRLRHNILDLIDNEELHAVPNFVFDASELDVLSIDFRRILTDSINELGFEAYNYIVNPSPAFKSFLSVLGIMNPNFYVRIIESREEALNEIVLRSDDYIYDKKVQKRWTFVSKDGRYRNEVLLVDGNVFVSHPSGVLDEEGVKESNSWFNLILKESQTEHYFRIQDHSKVESTSPIAIDLFNEWALENFDKMQMLVFSNISTAIEAFVKFRKNTAPESSKVVISQTSKDAFQVIDLYKETETISQSKADIDSFKLPETEEKKDNLIKELYNENLTQRLENVNELKKIFEILGRISWDKTCKVEEPDSDKAEYYNVYQALKMVHTDLNYLLTQKETQANKIRQKEAQLTILLQNIPNIAIYGLRSDGSIIYWNKASEEIFGIQRKDAIGKKLFELAPFEEHKVEIKKLLKDTDGLTKTQLINTGRHYTSTTEENGEVYLTGSTVFINRDKGGHVFRIDVNNTLQRKHEKEILEHRNNLEKLVEDKIQKIKNQERQFRIVLEKASQSIFVTHDFTFKYINKKGLDFFACTEEEIYTKKLTDFIKQEDNVNFVNKMTNQEEFVTVLHIKNNDGEDRWVELSAMPIEWDGLSATLNYIVDITMHKKTEDNLMVAKQKAEEADRLKSSFLANMSHEIRTPLNAIIGFSQLISQDQIPVDLRTKYFNLIDTNSKQLLDLIDDIIDIAKIESGQISINKTYFNVNEFIKEIHLSFKETIKQHDKTNDIQLLMKLPIRSEGVFINSDRQRIMQVFTNLLNNALKFTKSGNITLGYRMIDRFKLEFYVKDTGIGIQKEKQDVIFNRFHQLNVVKNNKAKGTGLGLAISKNIIELLGGDITVASEFGKGATFTFSLPYKSDFEDQMTIKPKKNIPALLDWSDKVILLAEDEESNYLFMKEALRRTKVELIWVENGQEAVDLLASEDKIDLILMDIQMPVLNGYEAIAKIKEEGYEVPIIAQTAYAMVEDKEKLLAAGFDSYLAKPIQINLLLSTLAEYIYS